MSKTYVDIINRAITSFNAIQNNLNGISAWYKKADNSLTAVPAFSASSLNLTSEQLAEAITHCAIIKNGTSFVTGNVAYKGKLTGNATPGNISIDIASSSIKVAAVSTSVSGGAGYYTGITIGSAAASTKYSTQIGTAKFARTTTNNSLADYTEVANSGISTKAPTTGSISTDYWKIDISTSAGSFSAGGTSVPIGCSPTESLYISKAKFKTEGKVTPTVERIAIDVNSVSSGSLFVPIVETTVPTSGKYIHLNIPEKKTTANGTFTGTVETGGYAPKGTQISANTSKEIKTIAKDVYIPITQAQYRNGYVTESGWIERNTAHYTLSYDANKQCVDFIFT